MNLDQIEFVEINRPAQRLYSQPDLLSKIKRHFKVNDFGDVLCLSLDELVSSLTWLKEKADFLLLDDIFADHLGGNRFDVYYSVQNLEVFYRLVLKVELDELDKLPSVEKLWKSASWHEAEIYDFYGIRFEVGELRRPFTHGHDADFPMRKDFLAGGQGEDLSFISRIGHREDIISLDERPLAPLVLSARSKKNKLEQVEIKIGQNYQQFEKKLAQLSFQDILSEIGGLNPRGADLIALTYCRLIENAMEISVGSRDQALRLVFTELNRIHSHLYCLIQHLNFLQYSEVSTELNELIENYKMLAHELQGERQLNTVLNLGGMALDVSGHWITVCLGFCQKLDSTFAKLEQKIFKSNSFASRLKNIAIISKKDAVSWNLSGPVLRASGVNIDYRKRKSFYFYDQLEFDIPLGINGDALDRFQVRKLEILESLKIVLQLIDNLPGKSKRNDPLDFQRPLLGHFFESLESTNGEFGLHLVVNQNEKRIKILSPSFSHAQWLEEYSNGLTAEQCQILALGLDLVSEELNK